MSDKIKISKIEVSTKDGKKVELSLEEAKDLHSQLDELFGQKTAPYIPYSPIIIERHVRPYWQQYNPVWRDNTIYCSSNSGLSVGYSGQEA